jgi:hypothetical protein
MGKEAEVVAGVVETEAGVECSQGRMTQTGEGAEHDGGAQNGMGPLEHDANLGRGRDVDVAALGSGATSCWQPDCGR